MRDIKQHTDYNRWRYCADTNMNICKNKDKIRVQCDTNNVMGL